MNFQEYKGWTFHILAEDCRTVLVGYRPVRDQEMLLRIIAKLNGNVADAKRDIQRWVKGSVWIDSGDAGLSEALECSNSAPDTEIKIRVIS